MRWLAIALLVVIVLLQHPLWLGKGGWLRVWEVDRQLAEQKEINKVLELRNAGLDAEVRDLKQGYDAIEERARFELGMVKQGEVFVQIPEKPAADQRAVVMPEKPPPAPVARAAAASAPAKAAASKPSAAVVETGRTARP
ncbi:cell division protein FtsB [Accumulibacter sp.]|uniref:cell division protein FtsB n=1 Tax=Accumulibacter sp. TaxID=2053492 RepID=UPI0025FDFF16|nr:cell division protein FtsB [Accumulibacter sp.]MCM8611780.1 cell division protein FtsB [Accumulibacter sp.]MCM8635682.1 cell division protein FtsB [Accumulibacter sp.]MCM8639323.1 cell division protein FtsB [Accumulibacter sp.]